METFEDLFRTATHSACHLEMRDSYEHDAAYLEWMAGKRFDPAERWPWWIDLVSAAVGRGVAVRRARVVSEPINDYTRYEYDLTTPHNIKAGESVRWLARQNASSLLLPANDLWLFDDTTVLFHHIDGDGRMTGTELVTDPDIAARCATAFALVWQAATPHEDYTPA